MDVTVHAFTNRANGLADVLISDIFVSPALTPSDNFEPKQFKALWDTGATNSVVTHRVAKECGLVPTGVVKVQLVGKEDLRNTYMVAIGLPNRVIFPGVKVTDADSIGGADVLIGMDIINQGDLAVTHGDGNTCLSFRVPSVEVIDFSGSHRLPKGAKEVRPGQDKPKGPQINKPAKSSKKTRAEKRKKKK